MLKSEPFLITPVIAILGIVMMVSALGCHDADPVATETRMDFSQPSDVRAPAWFPERQQRQLATTDRFDVFHQFRFTDAYEASGIRFSHKVVDDAGKRWKMVHYDHGNGLSIADVDNDGLYDIYFTNQVGANALWRNRGKGTFENITDRAGVGLAEAVSVASAFADTDNDGDQDLYVTTVRFGNHFFENDGTGRFTERSAAAGLDHVGHSSAALFFDYNRDGLVDLFLTNVGRYTTDNKVPVEGRTRFDDQEGDYAYYAGFAQDAFMGHLIPERAEANLLFENRGNNQFVDVSQATGLVDASWSGDATVIDVDEDGWQDVYILSMQGNDVLFRNIDGKRFEKQTAQFFPKTPWGAMGVGSFDYNNDGHMDLYVTDMHSDMWETMEFFDEVREKTNARPESRPSPGQLATAPGSNIFGNAFYRNEGNGRFTEMTQAIGAETYWPWGFSSGDLNADGYEDVFVASGMNFPYRYAVNVVLLNNRGASFLNSEFILAVEPRRDNRTAKVWFELDCPEDQDAFCDSYGNRPGKFDIWGALGSRSSVIFDLENDGDLDIVTNDFNSEPMVLVSNLSEQKPDFNYLKVNLTGTTSNRNGLGAVVRVTIQDDRQLTKVADGKSGYLAQSDLPLYFGLGESDTVRRIDVQWPSGQTQTIDGPIDANQMMEIVEPSASGSNTN